jgi:hypothetical protein
VLIDAGNDNVLHVNRFYNHKITTDLLGLPRKTGNSVDIGVFEHPFNLAPVFSYLTPDTIICDQTGSLKARPLPAFMYPEYKCIWRKNGKNTYGPYLDLSEITAPDGYYVCLLTHDNDTIWSSTIRVNQYSKPVIEQEPLSQTVCMGTDAEFYIKAKSGAEVNYNWYSLHKGQLPSSSETYIINLVTEPDTIYSVATNLCGSTASDVAMLNLLSLPEPTLGKDTSIYVTDSLLLDAGEGFTSYLWNGVSDTQRIYAHAGDTVWVMVTDSFSCSGMDTIRIQIAQVTSVPTIPFDNQPTIFPNPSYGNSFRVSGHSKNFPCTISIFSQYGVLIGKTEISNPEQPINIGYLTKGIYIVRIDSKTTSKTATLVVP